MQENEDAKLTLQDRLRIAREFAGLSQGQVAKLLQMHRPTITEIEQGRRKITAQELAEFAGIYAVDIGWLLGTESPIGTGLDAKIQLAARNLAKLKRSDLDRVIALLQAIQSSE